MNKKSWINKIPFMKKAAGDRCVIYFEHIFDIDLVEEYLLELFKIYNKKSPQNDDEFEEWIENNLENIEDSLTEDGPAPIDSFELGPSTYWASYILLTIQTVNNEEWSVCKLGCDYYCGGPEYAILRNFKKFEFPEVIETFKTKKETLEWLKRELIKNLQETLRSLNKNKFDYKLKVIRLTETTKKAIDSIIKEQKKGIRENLTESYKSKNIKYFENIPEVSISNKNNPELIYKNHLYNLDNIDYMIFREYFNKMENLGFSQDQVIDINRRFNRQEDLPDNFITEEEWYTMVGNNERVLSENRNFIEWLETETYPMDYIDFGGRMYWTEDLIFEVYAHDGERISLFKIHPRDESPYKYGILIDYEKFRTPNMWKHFKTLEEAYGGLLDYIKQIILFETKRYNTTTEDQLKIIKYYKPVLDRIKKAYLLEA